MNFQFFDVLYRAIGCLVFRMPIGYLMRLKHGRISIEIRVSYAYNVIDRRCVVKNEIDSCTKAPQDLNPVKIGLGREVEINDD